MGCEEKENPGCRRPGSTSPTRAGKVHARQTPHWIGGEAVGKLGSVGRGTVVPSEYCERLEADALTPARRPEGLDASGLATRPDNSSLKVDRFTLTAPGMSPTRKQRLPHSGTGFPGYVTHLNETMVKIAQQRHGVKWNASSHLGYRHSAQCRALYHKTRPLSTGT